MPWLPRPMRLPSATPPESRHFPTDQGDLLGDETPRRREPVQIRHTLRRRHRSPNSADDGDHDHTSPARLIAARQTG